MRNIILMCVLCVFASCSVQKEQVGNYNKQKGKGVVAEKGKDFYLFWELIPICRLEKKTKLRNYEKVVKRGFFDNVVYFGTIGVFSFYTVEIKIKEQINK